MRRNEITVEEIMDLTDKKHEWYDDTELIKKGKHWNIETSVRGYGKSTTIARRALANYIVNGSRFLYLRRTDRLLNTTKAQFFDTARELINDYVPGVNIPYMECTGNKYMIKVEFDDEDNEPPEEYNKDGEKIEMTPEEYELAKDAYRRKTAECGGLAMALSTGEEEAKSGGGKFKGIKLGIYDEFMAARGTSYLGSSDNPDVEFEAIYSIYMSVAREKNNPFLDDVYFFFLGNRSHDYNPILLNLGVNEYMAQSPNAHIIAPKNEEWAIEFIEPTEGFKNKQRNSVQYKLAQHSKKELEYNFENKSKDEEYGDVAVQKDMPKACRYVRGVFLNGNGYGIYYRERDGLLYIGKFQGDKEYDALDVASYANGHATRLVGSWRGSPILMMISDRFQERKVLFRDKETQRVFLQYLDFIPK